MISIDKVKDAAKARELRPDWSGHGKKQIRTKLCVNRSETPHPIPVPGERKFQMTAWIEEGHVVGNCIHCGKIEDLAVKLGLESPDVEPVSECLPEAPQGDSSPSTPTGDDSDTPAVKPAEIVAPTAPVPATPASNSYPRYERSPGGLSIDDLVNELDRQGYNPVKRGSGYTARCPAHDDQHPSLDVDEGRNGQPLTICRSAGCSFESILDALGLKGVGYEKPVKTPYHVRKGVKVHKPAYLSDDDLIIPCVGIDGKVKGTQTIWPEKRLLDGKETDKMTKGKGQNEYFFPFGSLQDSETILIATGYATSASLFESTGSPTVMSMSDTALPHTIETIRKRHAEKELIVCCDYDARNDKRILEAVNRCNALLCYPTIEGKSEITPSRRCTGLLRAS